VSDSSAVSASIGKYVPPIPKYGAVSSTVPRYTPPHSPARAGLCSGASSPFMLSPQRPPSGPSAARFSPAAGSPHSSRVGFSPSKPPTTVSPLHSSRLSSVHLVSHTHKSESCRLHLPFRSPLAIDFRTSQGRRLPRSVASLHPTTQTSLTPPSQRHLKSLRSRLTTLRCHSTRTCLYCYSYLFGTAYCKTLTRALSVSFLTELPYHAWLGPYACGPRRGLQPDQDGTEAGRP
jgi:hypothetical protein